MIQETMNLYRIERATISRYFLKFEYACPIALYFVFQENQIRDRFRNNNKSLSLPHTECMLSYRNENIL